MAMPDPEEDGLRSAALQNAQSIHAARRRAEDELRKQTEWLRITLSSIGDAVISTDAAGHITFMNAVAETLTGWSQAAAMGRPLPEVFRIVNEQSRLPVDNPALRALREGTIVGLANHTILIAKDGREWPIDDSAAPIRDESGVTSGAVLVFREISEKKYLEIDAVERSRLIELRGDISAALALVPAIPAALQRCCEALVQHLGAAAVRIWTLSEAGDLLQLQGRRGDGVPRDEERDKVSVGEGIIGCIAADCMPQFVKPSAGTQAFAGFPLVVENRVSGVLGLWSAETLPISVVAELRPLCDGIGQYLERRWAEEEARDVRSRLESTLAAGDVGTWEFDVVKNIVRADLNLARMFGVTAADADGGPMSAYLQAVHPDDLPHVTRDIERTLQSGTTYETEYRLVDLAGAIRWVVARGRVVRSAAGAALRLPGVVVDISARKLVEEELRASEEQRRLALDSAELGAWNIDPATNHLTTDRRFREIFGFTEERITRSQAQARVHPDDRLRSGAGVAAALDPDRRASYSEEYRILLPDGAQRWVLSRGRANFGRGDLARTVLSFDGTISDITERKTAEVRRTALNELGDRFRDLSDTLDLAYTAAEIMGHALGVSRAGYGTIDPVAETITIERDWNAPGIKSLAGVLHFRDYGSYIDDLKRGETVVIADAAEDERTTAEGANALREISALSLINMPVVEHGAFVALFYANHAVPRAWSVEEIDFIREVADRTRSAVERRRGDKALRESEARLWLAADAAELGIWVWDVAQDSLTWENNRPLQTFGLSGSEQTIPAGRFRSEFVHPEDVDAFQQAFADAFQNGGRFHFLGRLRGRDGKLRWMEFTGRVQSAADGAPLQIVGTIADVTEKRVTAERERQLLSQAANANAKFRAIFEQGALFAGIMDVQGAVLETNRLALDACGYTREQVVGRRFWECPWWSSSEELSQQIRFACEQAAQGETHRAERRYFLAGGEVRFVDLIILPIKDEAGRVLFLAATGADVTERKKLEEELRRVAADLSEADHRKNEFLAILAHELRNPLAPISNALHLIQLAAGDPQTVKSASEVMDRQIRQMVRLVDDLLDVSRITRGKIELRRQRIELAAVLQQAVETSRPALTAAKQQLSLRLPPQPVFLQADSVRLAQVFGNLLNNSCKYSDPNGRISITAEVHGGEVVVSVRDTGVGIPADMLPKVFQLFTQVDQSLDRAQGGLGIGLSLVKSLVELHGGSVSARSEGAGRGSEFSVRLPIAPEASQPLAPAPAGRAKAVVSRRILVVDDNRDSADSLALLLKATGHQTQTAHDGVAAVEKAQEFQPQVILLDIGLPKLNGYEAARRIREQPWGANIVLIALTGWGQAEDRQKSKAAGFDSHMVKPVDHVALMRLLNELPPPEGR